jgi:hypothetical protein
LFVPNWFAQKEHIHAHPVPEETVNWTHEFGSGTVSLQVGSPLAIAKI